MIYTVKAPKEREIRGEVTLNGSKSISNRVLVVRALCGNDFTIENLSNADDTVVLDDLLSSNNTTLDAGAGGTTFRFLTAYLSTCTGEEHILTGSERMKQRPIGILVDALRVLGADITYLEKEGYPPLKIKGQQLVGGTLSIPASTSSQYISAILMIAPTLKGGLKLKLEGTVVSIPYIEMTLNLMAYFGICYSWHENIITIEEGAYDPKDFYVEADWSAASYYYSIAALTNVASIKLNGLTSNSLQGDAVIAEIMHRFGIDSVFDDQSKSVVITKKNMVFPDILEYDFLRCPDLAQTVVAMCGALKVNGKFKGLSTLKIKETDRVMALKNELSKFDVHFTEINKENWELSSEKFNKDIQPTIETYDDHRMAMAFAPLCLKSDEVFINDPLVVSKSYPNFWKDLNDLKITHAIKVV